MKTVRSLPFVGIDDLDGASHVMVDGMGRPGSVLVLSHWPMTPSLPQFARDLSTQMALAYLGQKGVPKQAVAVSCDHFDEDGLASVFSFVEPEKALSISDAVVEFARIGDFGVVRNREVARSVLAIQALSDPERSLLFNDARLSSGANSATTACYEALLPVFEQVLREPDRFRDLFVEQEADYLYDVRSVGSPFVKIEEVDELGLAIVRVQSDHEVRRWEQVGHSVALPIGTWAIHSVTDQPRILVLYRGRPCYYDRYETWVRFVTRKYPLRSDLTVLANRLNDLEPRATRWSADSPSSLVPTLAPEQGCESALSDDIVVSAIRRYLESAPPSWDPFASSQPLITVPEG